MEDFLVFQSNKEIERLRVQNELLLPYEKPILDFLFSKGRDLNVLDIGCNDGQKTVSSFSYGSISKVIGLECNGDLAVRAEKEFGDDKFSFAALDAECDGFAGALERIMEEKAVDAFDCIYLSFVLMHLKDARKLLSTLCGFLKEGGSLVIVEANDSSSSLSGDDENLLGTFLGILERDKYSGNRALGGEVEKMVEECGYGDVRLWCDAVCAGRGERKKKESIIAMFFSYLGDDLDILLGEEGLKDDYRRWKDWLGKNWNGLESLILDDNSNISMGMKILTCRKGGEACILNH